MQDGQFTCGAEPKLRPFSFSWDQFLFADRIQRLDHGLRLENKISKWTRQNTGEFTVGAIKTTKYKDCVYFVDKYQFLYTPELLSF